MNDADVLDAAASVLEDHDGVLSGTSVRQNAADRLRGWARELERHAAKGGGPGPCTAGLFTRGEVTAAINAAADAAGEIANPQDIETSGTIAADDRANLIVNLAGQFLDDPAQSVDDAIWAAYCDVGIEPDFDGFQVWNAHPNDIGDYCPWSATPVSEPNDISGADDDRCPQGCRASAPADPPQGSATFKAALVEMVKSWSAS